MYAFFVPILWIYFLSYVNISINKNLFTLSAALYLRLMGLGSVLLNPPLKNRFSKASFLLNCEWDGEAVFGLKNKYVKSN